MHNKKKQIKKMLLVCLGVILLAGCATTDSNTTDENITMEKEQSNAISFDIIGGKDVMPIAGYHGPYPANISENGNSLPDYITDEYFEMIAEAGINLLTWNNIDYSISPELHEKYLDLAAKYKIGVAVSDSAILNKIGMDNISAEEVAMELAKYSDHPAYCGNYLIDEPKTPYFMANHRNNFVSDYEVLASVLHQELGAVGFTNLFPVIELEKNEEIYKQYVEDCLDTLQPPFVSFDIYPFDKDRAGKMEVYFWNLDVIREAAQKRNLPYWGAIAAGSQWNDGEEYFDSETPYYPNKGQFDWSVNTHLAFGVQGLDYFPLIQPIHFAYAKSTPWDFERNGMIGVMGNKTQWYYYAKEINQHIAAIDEVLMNSVHKGIIVSGEQAKKDMRLTNCVFEDGTFNQLQSVSGDAMVGCFNYNRKTALYVVNHSYENAQHITLKFDGRQNIRMIQNTKTSYVTTKKLELDMAAGEGVLVVLE